MHLEMADGPARRALVVSVVVVVLVQERYWLRGGTGAKPRNLQPMPSAGADTRRERDALSATGTRTHAYAYAVDA